MKKSFVAKRVPRKIGLSDQDHKDEEDASTLPGSRETTTEPVVKRPGLSSKPKKRSSLRLSFGPGEDAAAGSGTSTFTPKKSGLSRVAIENNAEKKSRASLSAADQLPFRASSLDDRPSYSKDYLEELKSSTPSRPQDDHSRALSGEDDEPSDISLDIASKFGPLTSLTPENPAIPTDAEIREKKERRARLAKEQEADKILLDDAEDPSAVSDDDMRNEISLRPQPKYAETRLVPDDEDFAEGFDAFVSDGTLSLGRRAERDAARRRRAEIQSMIEKAEGASSGGSDVEDDSDAERNAAYEAAQTRAGTYSNHARERREDRRPRTPPRIAPIPQLSSVLERLKATLAAMEGDLNAKVRRIEGLRAETKELAERGDWVQSQLKETGEKFEKLRAEAGIAAGGVNGSAMPQLLEGNRVVVGRGLESLGATPTAAASDSSDDG